MKTAIIDTNIYSAFKSGNTKVIKIIAGLDKIILCTTVLGEILSGFKCGTKEKTNRLELEQFMDAPRVSVIALNDETAEFYSEIYKILRNKGLPIPTNDMWIAAVGLQLGTQVLTYDSHFTYIDGLITLNPK